MAAIPLDKINYDKVSNHANVLIFKEFYPKTKNVSYYLNIDWHCYQFFWLDKGHEAENLQKECSFLLLLIIRHRKRQP